MNKRRRYKAKRKRLATRRLREDRGLIETARLLRRVYDRVMGFVGP